MNISCGPFLVEVTGLEPTTFWSLTRRATKLRYTSMQTAYLLYCKFLKKQTIFKGISKIFYNFLIFKFYVFTNRHRYYIITACGVGNWYFRYFL